MKQNEEISLWQKTLFFAKETLLGICLPSSMMMSLGVGVGNGNFQYQLLTFIALLGPILETMGSNLIAISDSCLGTQIWVKLVPKEGQLKSWVFVYSLILPNLFSGMYARRDKQLSMKWKMRRKGERGREREEKRRDEMGWKAREIADVFSCYNVWTKWHLWKQKLLAITSETW